MMILRCFLFFTLMMNFSSANGSWNQDQVKSHFKRTQSLTDYSTFTDSLRQIHENIEPDDQRIVEEVIRGYAYLVEHPSVPELRLHAVNDLDYFFRSTLGALGSQYGTVLARYFRPLFVTNFERIGENGGDPGVYSSTQFGNWLYYLGLLSNSSIELSRFHLQSLGTLSEQASSQTELRNLFYGVANNRTHHGSKLDTVADRYLSIVLLNAIQHLSELRDDDIQGHYDQLLLMSLVGANSIDLRQAAIEPILSYLYHPNITLRLESTKLVLETLTIPFENVPAGSKINSAFAKTIIEAVNDVLLGNYESGQKLWSVADNRKLESYIYYLTRIFEEVIVVHGHQGFSASATTFSESLISSGLAAKVESYYLEVAKSGVIDLLHKIGITYHPQIDIVAPAIFRIENNIK